MVVPNRKTSEITIGGEGSAFRGIERKNSAFSNSSFVN